MCARNLDLCVGTLNACMRSGKSANADDISGAIMSEANFSKKDFKEAQMSEAHARVSKEQYDEVIILLLKALARVSTTTKPARLHHAGVLWSIDVHHLRCSHGFSCITANSFGVCALLCVLTRHLGVLDTCDCD